MQNVWAKQFAIRNRKTKLFQYCMSMRNPDKPYMFSISAGFTVEREQHGDRAAGDGETARRARGG